MKEQGLGLCYSASVQEEEKGVGGQPVNQERPIDFSAEESLPVQVDLVPFQFLGRGSEKSI